MRKRQAMMWELLPLLNPARAARRGYGEIAFPSRRAAWAHHAGRSLRWLRELPAEIRQAAGQLREYLDSGGDPRTGGGAVVRWERNKWVIRPAHGFRSLRWTPALDRTRAYGRQDDDTHYDWADRAIARCYRRRAR